MDQSIAQLKSQKEMMKGMMEQTLDRKLKFLKYDYKRISYKMDETLFYLLKTIADIDHGPDPVTYISTLKLSNLDSENKHKSQTSNSDSTQGNNSGSNNSSFYKE